MTGSDRSALTLIVAALAVGIGVWAVGRLRPGVDSELARRGGTVVPVLYAREPAVSTALERTARALGPTATVDVLDGEPSLVVAGDLDPGPGFRPPRRLTDGRRAFRPTPDRAERWRKRAFNGLMDRLDDRLEDLPTGRGQATLPGAGELQLELTPEAPLTWLPALFGPGHLTLWHTTTAAADHLDIVRAEIDGSTLRIALRAAVRLGEGDVEARLDGEPVARGPATHTGLLELPLLPDLTGEKRAQVAMQLRHGPLPLPARAGPSRALTVGPRSPARPRTRGDQP